MRARSFLTPFMFIALYFVPIACQRQRITGGGDRYIILPNPMYGSWVNPVLHEDTKASCRERLVRSLISF